MKFNLFYTLSMKITCKAEQGNRWLHVVFLVHILGHKT